MTADQGSGETGKAGIPEEYPITIHNEQCGNCVFCISVCPNEALYQHPENKRVMMDVDKCALCGICYGACPSNLIEIDFYNNENLADYVREAMDRTGKVDLIVSCRGNTLTFEELKALIDEYEAIHLSLPCLGRVGIPFFLEIVESGIDYALLVPCEDEFCRFKEGSKVLQSRVDNANLMLEDMGLPPDCLDILKRHHVPEVDRDKCIVCGLCVDICAYDAPSIVKDEEEGSRYSRIDPEKCHSCGLCMASCPQRAISVPDRDEAEAGDIKGGDAPEAAAGGGGGEGGTT